MSELKPCPFCGKEVELFPSHFEGQWCVHPPVIHCTACHQDYEGAGIAICDAMNDAKKEDFADNLLCNWWNRRPAEDALNKELTEQAANYENIICEYKRDVKQAVEQIDTLTAEVERLKEVIAEIGAMTLTGEDDVEDFIFMLCKDTVSDEAIKQAYRKHLKNNIAKMLFGKDTNVPTNAPDTGKMEG